MVIGYFFFAYTIMVGFLIGFMVAWIVEIIKDLKDIQ